MIAFLSHLTRPPPFKTSNSSVFIPSSMASSGNSISFARSNDFSQSTGSATGEVHVIVGPMFAGKTTSLLRRIKAESNNGR